MRPHSGRQLFSNNAPSPVTTPDRVQHKSDDWSRVMPTVGGIRKWGAFVLVCLKCVLGQKQQKFPPWPHPSPQHHRPAHPHFGPAAKSRPLCVPHSCMDLSAVGGGGGGVDWMMITQQVFPVGIGRQTNCQTSRFHSAPNAAAGEEKQ